MSSTDNVTAIEEARRIAAACGQERGFDELMEVADRCAVCDDYEAVDKMCDSLIPNASEGMSGTFLPGMAMTMFARRARSRPAWQRLRDRVFATMESLRHHPDIPQWAAAMVDGWFAQHKHLSREFDSENSLPN
jgi:hypothetical protein